MIQLSTVKTGCRGCTACCTHMNIVEIESPAGERCKHETLHGCGIYESRPEGCRKFICAWAQGVIPQEWFPPQVGFFVYPGQEPDIICFKEIFEGVFHTEEAGMILRKVLEKLPGMRLVLIPFDPTADRVVLSRAKITPPQKLTPPRKTKGRKQ